jgi:hypothetical protein
MKTNYQTKNQVGKEIDKKDFGILTGIAIDYTNREELGRWMKSSRADVQEEIFRNGSIGGHSI